MSKNGSKSDLEALDWVIGCYAVLILAIVVALPWATTSSDSGSGPATPATTQNAPAGHTTPSKRPYPYGNSLPSIDNRLEWEKCRAHVLNPEDCNVPSGFEYVPGKGLLEVTNGRG